MVINFEDEIQELELGIRVRAIIGVPEEILEDSIISSPNFIIRASKYINKNISKYEEEDLQENKELINIAYLYYICYLLCQGMDARLPKQMENLSTKTIMQSIDWDSKALDMLGKCDDIIDEVLSEIDDSFQYGNTFATLSGESNYPNTNI